MWYSFDHGPMHVLMYSTEHVTAPGSPQYDFIQRDLAAVNRCTRVRVHGASAFCCAF